MVADYITELHYLTTHYAFRKYLEDPLWDRLVCGLHSEGAQRRLLATKNLALQEAVEAILSMKAPEKDPKALQGSKESNIKQISKA